MLIVTATGNETNNRVTMNSPDLCRIENDLTAEHWNVVVNESGMKSDRRFLVGDCIILSRTVFNSR